MADDLLFVYSSPGPVDLAEFTDWYDNEHVPARLATPGFGAVTRFRALDGLLPDWLATYEIKPGTLDTPAYQAVWDNASPREKQIMSSVSALDRTGAAAVRAAQVVQLTPDCSRWPAGPFRAEPCFQMVGPLAKGPSGSVSVSRQLATDSSNRARLS
jgi:hypothetical protein